ncbi:hypothetical protein MK489_10315 [Myxococcota bacterium]|nr:hypothetical protein [Myxococcota bacterium]
MSFESTLGEIVDECGGGLAAALMSEEGIAIAQVEGRHRPGEVVRVDAGTAGVEFGRILEAMRKTARSIEGGEIQETVVVMERFSLIFRPVDAECSLVVAVARDGNLGKARYLMRRSLISLREELSP